MGTIFVNRGELLAITDRHKHCSDQPRPTCRIGKRQTSAELIQKDKSEFMPSGNIAQLVAAFSGDPTGVSTTIFDAPKGALVLDTTGGQPRVKGGEYGDNSNFTVLGNTMATNPTTIAAGQTAVVPANSQAIIFGTFTITGTLTIIGEIRFGAWPF